MEWLEQIQFDCKEVGNAQYENIKIIIREETVASIKKKSKKLIGPKSFGLLIGNKYKDKDYVLIYIEDVMPLGTINTASNGYIFVDKRWTTIKERIQKNNPGKEIVGWYGVRTGWEAMATEEDQRIHQSYFDKPWQIIYLYDRKNNSANFYYWYEKRLNSCKGYYQLEDSKKHKKNKEVNIPKQLFKGAVILGVAILLVGLYTKFIHPDIIFNDDNENEEKSSLNNNFLKEGEETANLFDKDMDKSKNEKPEPLELDRKNIEQSNENVKQSDSKDMLDSVIENQNDSVKENEEASLEESIGNNEEVSLGESIENVENEQEEGLQDPGNISEDGAIIHVIKKGDTLIELSKHYYGDPNYMFVLAKLNRISDHRTLRVGDYLIIPSKDEIEKLK